MSYYPQVPAGTPVVAYAAQPGYMPAAVIVEQPQMAVVATFPAKRPYVSGLFECCGGPGGCETCCYVWCCPCCAAGDIAAAAGRDYCMSCFVCPVCCPCLIPGHLARDREAFANNFNIQDDIDCFCACLLFACGCGHCLLCQEYAALKAYGYTANVGGSAVVVAPAQQVLMPAAPIYQAL